MQKHKDEGRTKSNTDAGQFNKTRQNASAGQDVPLNDEQINYPRESDQGGKFSPRGKAEQSDWQNQPGEGKPSAQGRTSKDSSLKGPQTGVERSGGTAK